MNKGSIVERLCSDLDRKEPRYKSPTLLFVIEGEPDSRRLGSESDVDRAVILRSRRVERGRR